MTEKVILEAELKIINDYIARLKKKEIIYKSNYVCDTILELLGNPYNYLCWHCNRWVRFGLIQRCSWVRLGGTLGNRFSPLFGMTGLELLEEMKKEVEKEIT